MTIAVSNSTTQSRQNIPLKFPLTLNGTNSPEKHFVLFQSKSNKARAPKRPTHEISLYMPTSALKTQYQSSYRDMEGILSEVSKEAFEQMNKIKGEGNITDSIIDNYLNLDTFQTAIQSEVARSIKKADITKRVLSGAGIAVNPKLNMMYDGPAGMRTHNFNFMLNPKNNDESIVCKEIIQAFKTSMLPGFIDSTGKSQSFFEIPLTFDITFSHGTKLGSPFRIKESVLTDMSVDYAGGGTPLFFEENNEPASISLDLTFKETSIITREDAEKGY